MTSARALLLYESTQLAEQKASRLLSFLQFPLPIYFSVHVVQMVPHTYTMNTALSFDLIDVFGPLQETYPPHKHFTKPSSVQTKLGELRLTNFVDLDKDLFTRLIALPAELQVEVLRHVLVFETPLSIRNHKNTILVGKGNKQLLEPWLRFHRSIRPQAEEVWWKHNTFIVECHHRSIAKGFGVTTRKLRKGDTHNEPPSADIKGYYYPIRLPPICFRPLLQTLVFVFEDASKPYALTAVRHFKKLASPRFCGLKCLEIMFKKPGRYYSSTYHTRREILLQLVQEQPKISVTKLLVTYDRSRLTSDVKYPYLKDQVAEQIETMKIKLEARGKETHFRLHPMKLWEEEMLIRDALMEQFSDKPERLYAAMMK